MSNLNDPNQAAHEMRKERQEYIALTTTKVVVALSHALQNPWTTPDYSYIITHGTACVDIETPQDAYPSDDVGMSPGDADKARAKALQYVADVESDAVFAKACAREAIRLIHMGDVHGGMKGAIHCGELEMLYGDDPCYGVAGALAQDWIDGPDNTAKVRRNSRRTHARGRACKCPNLWPTE